MENLRQLMAAYFHQDWQEEYGDVWESAVDDFARREPHRIAGATDEIATLLTAADSDEAVGRALDALGNFRVPARLRTRTQSGWSRFAIGSSRRPASPTTPAENQSCAHARRGLNSITFAGRRPRRVVPVDRLSGWSRVSTHPRGSSCSDTTFAATSTSRACGSRTVRPRTAPSSTWSKVNPPNRA